MKTVAETFLLNDSLELIYENALSGKWRQIIEKLNLRGQLTSLLETPDRRKAVLEEYNLSPVSVEVPERAALSHQEGYFDKMQIPYDGQTEHFVCVDSCCAGEHNGPAATIPNMNRFLIDRCREVKSDFEQLKQKACRLCREHRVTERERPIRAAQRELVDIDREVVEKIG